MTSLHTHPIVPLPRCGGAGPARSPAHHRQGLHPSYIGICILGYFLSMTASSFWAPSKRFDYRIKLWSHSDGLPLSSLWAPLESWHWLAQRKRFSLVCATSHNYPTKSVGITSAGLQHDAWRAVQKEISWRSWSSQRTVKQWNWGAAQKETSWRLRSSQERTVKQWNQGAAWT